MSEPVAQPPAIVVTAAKMGGKSLIIKFALILAGATGVGLVGYLLYKKFKGKIKWPKLKNPFKDGLLGKNPLSLPDASKLGLPKSGMLSPDKTFGALRTKSSVLGSVKPIDPKAFQVQKSWGFGAKPKPVSLPKAKVTLPKKVKIPKAPKFKTPKVKKVKLPKWKL
jgi:hypothetical protein